MMGDQPLFTVEPWALRVTGLELDAIGQFESIFALSNGHVGLRGTLDEGEPHSAPGSYLNGFFEHRPYTHPEIGYGLPDAGQAMINVTDGKLIRLIVGDSPLDLRYGRVLSHEQSLDFRTGLLTRRTEWTSPGGRSVRLVSQRDLHNNLHQGLHIASLAGAWNVAVAGFGGMRDHDGHLTFAPRLPPGLTRLTFRLSFQGRCLRVEVDPNTATYRLLHGDPYETTHHTEPIRVTTDSDVKRVIPPPPSLGPIRQPPGRAPYTRIGGEARLASSPVDQTTSTKSSASSSRESQAPR